jgi:hypothetical protein
MGGPTPRAGSVRADLALCAPRTATAGWSCRPSTRRWPPALRRGRRCTPWTARITFAVDVLGSLRPHGAELVGEVTQYENIYRYCYIRGPEGIIGLVQDLR